MAGPPGRGQARQGGARRVDRACDRRRLRCRRTPGVEVVRAASRRRRSRRGDVVVPHEGAEMTRVDRPRADGWTVCGTCGGSGKVASSCSDQCDYEVACPDCVDGRVPPDGMVEAAARWAHAEMGRRSGVGLTWEVAYPEEQADYMRIARSMLVAAARWEAPE